MSTVKVEEIQHPSNSNNAVSWGSGSKDIFATYPASKAVPKGRSVGLSLIFGG